MAFNVNKSLKTIMNQVEKKADILFYKDYKPELVKQAPTGPTGFLKTSLQIEKRKNTKGLAYLINSAAVEYAMYQARESLRHVPKNQVGKVGYQHLGRPYYKYGSKSRRSMYNRGYRRFAPSFSPYIHAFDKKAWEIIKGDIKLKELQKG